MNTESIEKGLLGRPYGSSGPFTLLDRIYGLDMDPTMPVNCQAAVQIFYKLVFNTDLYPYQVLSKEGFRNGIPVVANWLGDSKEFFGSLTLGDVIWAEPHFVVDVRLTREELLHTAVFLGRPADPVVRQLFGSVVDGRYEESQLSVSEFLLFHATNKRSGGTMVWGEQLFLEYYNPVVAKRLLTPAMKNKSSVCLT